MSDTDPTFNFIHAMIQSQLINLLCDKADDEYGGRLPVHVRLLLDEFANIGRIPHFDKLIATIRSREISAAVVLKSLSQLKAIYKDAAEIISDNCDSTLFLSGRGKNAKEISDALGKETIDLYNTGENRGREQSHSLTYQKLGKELMTQDEIAVMDGGKILTYVSALAEYGTRIGQPTVKHIEGSIWELRPLSNRIFFFYWKDNTFVLLHHFVKKSQKTPEKELERARLNLKDFIERNGDKA